MTQCGEILDVLACDIQARPRGAASVFDLAPAVRRVRREPCALVIEFTADAAPAVAEFAAAERLCCPEIGWELHDEQTPTLRIRAMPAQLEVLQQLFSTRKEKREKRR